MKCDTFNEKSVRVCVNVRVCASGEVFCVHSLRRVPGSCHCLSAKSRKTTTNQQLRLLSCSKSVKQNQDCGKAFWLMVTTSGLSSEVELSSFLVLVSTSLRTRADVVSFHHFSNHLSSCQLC